MARIDPQSILDLEKELDSIRNWEGIRERSPAVFYKKSQPFLHFHDAGAERRADVKIGRVWQRVAIPAPSTIKTRKEFLQKIHKLYLG